MVDKNRLKVVSTDRVPILKMEDIKKGEAMKEIEKMEKRGKELVAENERDSAEIEKCDKELNRVSSIKQQLINQVLERNGAIKEVNNFLNVLKEKNKDTLEAEVKKEEKKESKKGVS